MAFRILFRCDDSGSMRAATDAIVDACTRGVGRCTSVMVPGPAFEASVPALKALAASGEVELGLHIVLNAEWEQYPGSPIPPSRWGPVLPASKVPTLVRPDGTFKPFPMDFHNDGASTDEMAAEVAAQLDKALSLGLPLTYADEHMGVGWLPGLAEKLKAVVAARGLELARDAELEGLPKIEGLTGDAWTVLAEQIRRAPDGDYLYVTHPCYDTPESAGMMRPDKAPGVTAAERELDRKLLTHPDVKAALRGRHATLLRYKDVL